MFVWNLCSFSKIRHDNQNLQSRFYTVRPLINVITFLSPKYLHKKLLGFRIQELVLDFLSEFYIRNVSLWPLGWHPHTRIWLSICSALCVRFFLLLNFFFLCSFRDPFLTFWTHTDAKNRILIQNQNCRSFRYKNETFLHNLYGSSFWFYSNTTSLLSSG